jgi:hypothetical protein
MLTAYLSYAYSGLRYQEGRKMWTNITIASRNIAQIVRTLFPLPGQIFIAKPDMDSCPLRACRQGQEEHDDCSECDREEIHG